MLSLEIPHAIFEAMVEHARAEAPVEVCGILAGEAHRVQKLYPMGNADRSCDHFMMAPAEQFRVVKEIRAAGLQMLAVYHSHPATPARPSAEDIRLALTPGVAYVIVSLQNAGHPVLKGFKIRDGRAAETKVRIIDAR
jgi:proteasome lid subunit RPN8/RPN11